MGAVFGLWVSFFFFAGFGVGGGYGLWCFFIFIFFIR